jgi:threonine dehydrogenase-like Zn-dependent dehydrogenase
MQALVTEPGRAHSARVEEVEAPKRKPGEVPVRVLEVGVCGTDREIAHGLFGVAPDGGSSLIIGHELLGVVDSDGEGFSRGDHVAAIVRRSCGHCIACADDSPDSCLTGAYSERGITRLDGFARELVCESADQLIPVPKSLGRLGVLGEPTSICMRALRHATTIGERQPWPLRRALVIGGGPIGVLTTILLRLDEIEVCTASLEPKNEPVSAVGATYVSVEGTSVSDLGMFDLVVVAAGDAQLMADSLALLRRNGVACLLGIDGRDQRVRIEGRVIGVDAVLENRVLFGSVNAHRWDWHAGVDALDRARGRWPGALESLVGLRVPLDRFAEAFDYSPGKATLVLDG